LVLVDDALADGLVQLAGRVTHEASGALGVAAAAASWNLRIAVFSDDLTDLFRSRRFSFCRLRLIWDLMFATRQPRL
jgi:hypothetical protein